MIRFQFNSNVVTFSYYSYLIGNFCNDFIIDTLEVADSPRIAGQLIVLIG